MAGGVNNKDLQIISDGVLSGNHTVDQLPKNVQGALSNYWGSLGVNMDDPSSQLTQQQLAQLSKSRADAANGGSFLDSPIFKPIEWIGSKIYQVYSDTISPTLSAGVMALHSVMYGRPDYIGEDGEWDAMKDYWNYAHKISPGQAVWELGLNNKELDARGISPDQMALDSSLAKQGKYKDAATANDPFGIRTRADEYFGSGPAKYVTGATDFAVSWYADPTVLAGKALSAGKAIGFTRNVGKIAEEPGLAKRAAYGLVGKAAPSGEDKLTRMFDGNAFQNMTDLVMKVKKDNPNAAAVVLRDRVPTIKQSANGDALARLLTQAKDADEVSSVLRLSMGDNSVKTALEIQNAKIGDQVNSLTARNVIHGAHYDGLTDIQKATPRGQQIKAALDNQTKYVNQLNTESRVIDDKLDAFRSVENMNFNSLTTPLGVQVKGANAIQDGSRLKQVRGQGLVAGATHLVYNATVGAPIKVIRAYNDIKPTAYIDVHAEDSHRAVDAILRDAKLSRGYREKLVSDYINATPNERPLALTKMESGISHKMVDRHNLKAGPDDQISYELANDLYKEYATRRKSAQGAGVDPNRSYGSATMPDPANPAQQIRVAAVDVDGSRVVSTPLFETQLANSHVMMDFNAFEKALTMHGSSWMKAKARIGDGWSTATHVADQLNSMWKFAQLFRLGYGPRALADDFLGQVARFGPMSIVDSAARGGKIKMQDFFHAHWASDDVVAARLNHGLESQKLENLVREQEAATGELRLAQSKGVPADIEVGQQMLDDITEEIGKSKQTIADYGDLVNYGSNMRDVRIGRQISSPAFGGQQGEMFRDLAAGRRNLENMMGSSSDWYLKRMRRKDWVNIAPETHGAEEHMGAWMRHVNDQIGKSAVGRQALAGKSDSEIAGWMKNSPEGQRYRNDIGLKNMPNLELAQRVKAQVDYVLNPAMPGMDVVRQAVLDGKLEKEMLEAVPVGARPMVNAEQWHYAEGTSDISKLIDKGITGFYNLTAQMPAEKLLKNPMFGGAYKDHLAHSYSILEKQGVTHVTEADRRILETQARKAALQQVKKYTFTMDHETKMAHSLRHFGAFFGAQQESWNRWARIISDKPDVLAHVAQTYQAPARAGVAVDQNNNPIDGEGYSTDPVTGERKLVKFSDRKLLVQIPSYLGGKALNKALGLDPDASFVIPMSSLNIIMNTGDGALPVGAGPMVSIAVNHFAQEDPKVADWAQKLGVLPFGTQDSWTDFVNPTTGKRLGDSMDEMGDTKQRAIFYSMQVENYKYQNGLRKTAPTWKELSDRADRWTAFRTGIAFGLPFSVSAQDPYQYFRDEFKRMQTLDYKTADEKFYEKYGDSFYAFSQSMSKNNTGLQPTAESVKMSKYYQDLVAQVGPEYAGLIVGSEGDGVYSNGAYHYQKTHSSDVASNITQRTNMSAREAWDASMKSKGWQQYSTAMNGVYTELFKRGLTSVDDAGAEDLKDQQKAIVYVLGKNSFADGSDNPFYNEQWEKDFSQLDKGKYDRTAFDLQKVVDDPELWSKAVGPNGTVGIRSDIYTLKAYLDQRKQMSIALAQRKIAGGSDDINTQTNADLKGMWGKFTVGLIEADTKFAWIHSRYFATDLGFNMDSSVSQQDQQAMETSPDTLSGQTQPNIFDIMSQEGDTGGTTV